MSQSTIMSPPTISEVEELQTNIELEQHLLAMKIMEEMECSNSFTASYKSKATVYSRLMGEMRRYASLNGMESVELSSSLTASDWGDLNENCVGGGEKKIERRAFLAKSMSDNVPVDDSRRYILEKEILDDLEPFPKSSLRYLPIILRDSYAMRQTVNPSNMGNARLAQIELRLRLRRPRKLPYFRDLQGAILILDMSGFTALGERLRLELGPREGAAEFARKVNTILSSMVNQVHKHDGDVLMFAGDALICLFVNDDEDTSEKNQNKTLGKVRDCCLNVLGEVATTSEGDFTVHGGASYGLVRCFFLGTRSSIPGDCAFVVSGRPLRRAGILLDEAQKGQVYIEGLGGNDLITEQEGKQVFCFQEEKKTKRFSRQRFYQEQSLRNVSAVLFRQTGMLSMDLIDKFDIHPFARAYISKLQARRGDFDSQNAMSILNNELRRVAIVFVGLRDLDYVDLTINTSIDLINDCFISLSHITHSCNGAVRDMLVDDKGCVFIAVFGAHSHELNPCFDATVCALRMRSALVALELKKFSLGVSYGDCFCGEVGPSFRSDFVVMGPEVNMAARLMAKAPNHGILVSKRIYSNSSRDIQFRQTSEELKVKGKNESFYAYHPVLRKRRYSRVSSHRGNVDGMNQRPIILMPSRKAIFDKIYKAVECAKAGTPKLAYVISAPFLGKTTLIHEISKRANQVLGFNKFRSFRTSLDSNTSYFPFRQILSSAMQQCASMMAKRDMNDNVMAMSHLISCNLLNKTDRVAIGSILSSVIDPQLMTLFKGQNPTSLLKSLIDSLLKIMFHLQPLMMIFEGDGELDPSSWNLLSELMKQAKIKCPQLFIIISFKENPPVPVNVMNILSEAIHEELLPFDENETEIFIMEFLGVRQSDARIDKSVVNVVRDRSNGSPTFMEYVMTWVLEKDMLEYTGDGRTLSLKDIDKSSDDAMHVIPRELSDIVLAPFNSLSPVLWDALKIASCVGFSFDASVYGELKSLNLIPRIGLLTSDHDAFERCNMTLYKWKHQAVYEAVKSLLLTQQRIEIHKVIVKAFEERMQFFANNPDLCDEVHRLLARHCSLAEMWESAFNQYMQAGEYAERTFKFSEAAKMYEEAIAGQVNVPAQSLSARQRLSPKIRLGVCYKEQANYKAAERILSQCLIEAERDVDFEDGDEMTLVHALVSMASLHQAQSKYHVAKDLYSRVLPISRKMQSSSSSLWLAGIIAGYAETLRKSGDLPLAEKMHREVLEIRHRAIEDQCCTEIEIAVSYTQLGCTVYGMNKYEEAYEHHRSALKSRSQYLDFNHALVSESLNYCAECLCALEKPDDALPLAMHAVKIRKNIFGLMHPALAHALSILASCYHKSGRSHDALIHLKKCLQICENAFDKNHANNIPNLISFADVLRATGKYKKARSVYKQAITIHSINFTADQKVDQSKRCKAGFDDMTKIIADSDDTDSILSGSSSIKFTMNVPQVDAEAVGTPVIILTDIGRDVDDEMSFVLLASLKRMCLLNPLAIVTTLSPQKDRAWLARGSLDALGMVNVPVGIGSSGGVDEGAVCDFYGGDYARNSCTIVENGLGLFVQALESSQPKSVQFLCMTSLTDAAILLKDHEQLFLEKIKEVVIMGGVNELEASEYLEPDSAFNNMCDIAAAKYFYLRCQQIGVPTVTVSRWASHGCTISSSLFDELAKTNHMIANNIKNVCETNLMKLWNKVSLPPSDPKRESLPDFYDRGWFCRTFIGRDVMEENMSVWSQIEKLNLYSPLALFACVPAFRETHFKSHTKMVDNTLHHVIGTSMTETGVVDATHLYDEFFVLFLAAYKNSLKLI